MYRMNGPSFTDSAQVLVLRGSEGATEGSTTVLLTDHRFLPILRELCHVSNLGSVFSEVAPP